ncbi:putative major allergen Mal f 1 precursor [Violaceomyces palustris]|uniref:Major allergen Mal f 1 n=1 Tax=Violaceomyces palustris TaxID=1673888 RepID=A0ACD0P7I4_9BASI|nr:putative major allergen Mal f 1 precursor [Violaceomyces palustris]
MHFSILPTFTALAVAVSLVVSAPIPDSIVVKVKNLTPEDTVFDRSRNVFYQSNLWKGQISVWGTDNSHFNLLVPGVSSSGYGDQQMAGLSIDKRTNANRLYAVAKDAGAFRFDSTQSKNGACSFHAFNLPVSASSKPAWSVYFDKVQRQFEAKFGTRPFGPVDSAQDSAGNSYVVFALGIPAIAKISPDGKTVEAWYAETSNGSQRPGFTGVQYVPSSNKIVAYGGPRPLTSFDLNSPVATATPVKLNGDFGSLSGTEKLTMVPHNGRPVLVGTKAPLVYAFTSQDNWLTASFKTATRSEFNSNDLTVVTEANLNGAQQIYGGGAYFANGARGGRTDYPLYRIPISLLE